MSQFNKQTTIEEIAAAYPAQVAGHSFFITGGSLGLGREVATTLVKHDASVVFITSRSAERCVLDSVVLLELNHLQIEGAVGGVDCDREQD